MVLVTALSSKCFLASPHLSREIASEARKPFAGRAFPIQPPDVWPTIRERLLDLVVSLASILGRGDEYQVGKNERTQIRGLKNFHQ